jgi:dolichol kinase
MKSTIFVRLVSSRYKCSNEIIWKSLTVVITYGKIKFLLLGYCVAAAWLSLGFSSILTLVKASSIHLPRPPNAGGLLHAFTPV